VLLKVSRTAYYAHAGTQAAGGSRRQREDADPDVGDGPRGAGDYLHPTRLAEGTTRAGCSLPTTSGSLTPRRRRWKDQRSVTHADRRAQRVGSRLAGGPELVPAAPRSGETSLP
jgi:hypothetical protein